MTKNDVCEFVALEARVQYGLVNPSTSITDLLHWEGNDIVEFLHRFARKFSVDMTPFPFRAYFFTEAGCRIGCFMVVAMIFHLVRYLQGKPLPGCGKKSLFVWQLIRAAELGRWTDECELVPPKGNDELGKAPG